ncbi:MAG: hypothetical protein WC700_14475 [Gemmatimonadaceae bacterium]
MSDTTASIGYPPIHTPWGRRDYCESVSGGVFFVGTPSHGGLAVAVDPPLGPDAASIANQSRYSFVREGWAWLEEDCDAPRFAATHGIS